MSNPVPIELQAKITHWRHAAATNSLTLEEMKEAVKYLRAGRVTAMAAAGAAKRKTAIKVIPNADDLLSEME
jgi:hypothetical protein